MPASSSAAHPHVGGGVAAADTSDPLKSPLLTSTGLLPPLKKFKHKHTKQSAGGSKMDQQKSKQWKPTKAVGSKSSFSKAFPNPAKAGPKKSLVKRKFHQREQQKEDKAKGDAAMSVEVPAAAAAAASSDTPTILGTLLSPSKNVL